MSGVKDLRGAVVAITGGANGIGREIARLCVANDATVAIGDYAGDAARSAAAELGTSAHGYDLDVSNRASFEKFIASVESAHGPIDILINSAGVLWVGAFGEEPDSAAERQFAVNLHGVIHSMKIMAPLMNSRGRGQIITIASVASLLPVPGEATYAASKHAVHGYLKSVREEVKNSPVQLTVIMPTVVETTLAAGTSTGAAKILQPIDVAKAVVKVVGRHRFEVTVPGWVGPVQRFVNLLPQRLRDLVIRIMVPEQVKLVKHELRQDYEDSFFRPPGD